jgi:hypothetical protein
MPRETKDFLIEPEQTVMNYDLAVNDVGPGK